jgi:hypothetical protein
LSLGLPLLLLVIVVEQAVDFGDSRKVGNRTTAQTVTLRCKGTFRNELESQCTVVSTCLFEGEKLSLLVQEASSEEFLGVFEITST